MKKTKKTLLSIFMTAATVVSSASSLCANAAYIETNRPKEHSDYIRIDYLSNETTDFYIRKGENSNENNYMHRILVEKKLNDRVYFGVADPQNEQNYIPPINVPDEISALFKDFKTANGNDIKVYTNHFNKTYEYYVAPYSAAQTDEKLSLTPNDARRIKEILAQNNIADTMSYSNTVYNPSGGYTYLTNLKYSPTETERRINEETVNTLKKYLADNDYDVTLMDTEKSITLTPNKETSLEEHLELLKGAYEACGLQIECMIEASASENFSGIDLYNAVDGDANCDEAMNLSDAVAIMQSIANPDKYQLSEQGKFNSDLNGDGITNNDALDIQKKLLGLE